MTLDAAQNFIRLAVNDPDLVRRINQASDNDTMEQILIRLQMTFSNEEFEQAYFNILTWCRTMEQAEVVNEVKLWWDCLRYWLDQPSKCFFPRVIF